MLLTKWCIIGAKLSVPHVYVAGYSFQLIYRVGRFLVNVAW
jgi:hypothetical protein